MEPLFCDCCQFDLDPDAATYDRDTGLLLCPGCVIAPLDDTLGPALPTLEDVADGKVSLPWF